MRRSRNFRQGCPGLSAIKKFWQLFLYSSTYFTEVQWSNSKTTNFPRFQRVSNSQGVQLFPGAEGGGGSNCLFTIEIYITGDFPGGYGPPVLLWIRAWKSSWESCFYITKTSAYVNAIISDMVYHVKTVLYFANTVWYKAPCRRCENCSSEYVQSSILSYRDYTAYWSLARKFIMLSSQFICYDSLDSSSAYMQKWTNFIKRATSCEHILLSPAKTKALISLRIITVWSATML